MNKGWIKMHRSICGHWVFQNDKFFKWWFIVLIESNHKDADFLCGYDVYKIKRGQSCKSLRKWAELFNSNTKQVTKFFDLLEKEGMIKRETIGKMKQSTTLITIENYDSYQGGNETQPTTQVTTQPTTQVTTQVKHNRDTNNNDNNNKELKELEKEKEFFQDLEQPIDNELSLKMEKASDFIKKYFDYSNENEIKSFLSVLNKENKLSEFGKQTNEYLRYLKLSNTDLKFRKSFKTWMIDWEDENWTSKINNLESVKTELTPTQLENKKKERLLRESITF